MRNSPLWRGILVHLEHRASVREADANYRNCNKQTKRIEAYKPKKFAHLRKEMSARFHSIKEMLFKRVRECFPQIVHQLVIHDDE